MAEFSTNWNEIEPKSEAGLKPVSDEYFLKILKFNFGTVIC
jgi:hypothetical protein